MKNKKWLIILISLLGVISVIAGIYLTFNKKEYKVTFNLNNGSNDIVVKVKEGKSVKKIDDPKRDGYTFVEWVLEGSTYNFENSVDSDIILDAIWKKNSLSDEVVYNVIFDTDGGNNIASDVVVENSKITRPTDPKKDGYTFVEWVLDGKTYDFDSPVTSDITLKAKWEEIKYTVHFDTDGGSTIKDVLVSNNTKVTRPADPKRDGYTFVEWRLDGKTYDFNSLVTGNITLKALWNKIADNSNSNDSNNSNNNNSNGNNNSNNSESKKYTVNFDTDGGNSVSSQTVTDGDKASRPVNPKRDGYTFVEWQLNGKTYNFNTKITGNITLKALWKKNETVVVKEYTVSFDTDGGSSITSKTVTEGSVTPRPSDPIKSGYTFVEWQLNGKTYDFNTKVTSNITLKAKWEKNEVKSYTVSFDTDGGSSITSKTVTEGSVTPRPNDPIKSGYTFVEWQLNGKTYDFNTKVTGNITLKAKWIQKSYTISLSKVDEYSPDRYLTVYENGSIISVKKIAYTDGTSIACTINGNKITVSSNDIAGETQLLVTLMDGGVVLAVINDK